MNKKKVNAFIILGIISIISILIVQIIWIKKTENVQEIKLSIQQKKDSLEYKHFVQNVFVALLDVAQEIQFLNNGSKEVYDVVKQLSTNYFVVQIDEPLNPYLLERELKNTFYKEGIRENFQYGIYDCFTDSIVYGNLIKYKKSNLNSSIQTESSIETPQIKLDNDSHYFSVLFPNIENHFIDHIPSSGNPWIYLVLISMASLIFFAYAISIILKQRKLSEIQTDFINNMTHELKTPISTISLTSESILKNDLHNNPSKLQKYVAIIFKENKRLEKQVEQVLSIAKLNQKKVKLHKNNMNLHHLIFEVKENIEQGQLNFKKGKIILKLNAIKTNILCDKIHLTNVFYNLIDNAFKYCEKTPIVTIKTYNQNNGICIDFVDNGIGIKKENQKYIFDKFYRVSTGNVHNIKGFGLGLFYVKEIIEQHNGIISLKSSIGKGSVFKIFLTK